MMDDYGSSGVSMFDTWILFGDPSLRVVDRGGIQTPTISFWGVLLLLLVGTCALRKSLKN